MNFKKISALACAMTIMGGLAQAVPAYANTIESGDTKVIYDNRQVLPDGNGEYGMIIPTAIAFTDENMSGNADVEITGINGYELTDWSVLSVKASVKSKNSYKLKLNDSEDEHAIYGLSYVGNEDEFTANALDQEITKRLGIGSDNQNKVTGTATLKDKSGATKKGQYKDTLTYSFTELVNTKK